MLSPESFKLVSRTNGRLTPEEYNRILDTSLVVAEGMCVFPNLGPVYFSFGFTWRVFETTVTAQRS
jgi:hypothetical protein